MRIGFKTLSALISAGDSAALKLEDRYDAQEGQASLLTDACKGVAQVYYHPETRTQVEVIVAYEPLPSPIGAIRAIA